MGKGEEKNDESKKSEEDAEKKKKREEAKKEELEFEKTLSNPARVVAEQLPQIGLAEGERYSPVRTGGYKSGIVIMGDGDPGKEEKIIKLELPDSDGSKEKEEEEAPLPKPFVFIE